MEGKTNFAYYPQHILVIGTLIDECMMPEVVVTPLFFHRQYQLLLEEETAEFLQKNAFSFFQRLIQAAKRKL